MRSLVCVGVMPNPDFDASTCIILHNCDLGVCVYKRMTLSLIEM